MTSKPHEYRIRMKMGEPEYGRFTKEQIVPEGYNTGCDGFMYVSILWPKGTGVGMSVQWGGMDGRTQKPLDDNERFKIWTMLAADLAESIELGEGRKSLCAEVIERVRNAMKEVRGKEWTMH